MRYKLSTIGNDYRDGGDGDSDSESINTAAAAAADAVASGLSYDLISHLLLISCIYIHCINATWGGGCSTFACLLAFATFVNRTLFSVAIEKLLNVLEIKRKNLEGVNGKFACSFICDTHSKHDWMCNQQKM